MKDENTTVKKEEKKRNIFLIITMVLMTIYLIWRATCTIPFEAGILNAVCGILLLSAETITVWTTFELFIQKMQTKGNKLELPVIPDEYYPHVDVFIATHNEPVELLYKTVNACVYMDYPDKSKVHIYLCDDGNRPAVAELARQFGVGYLGLKENKDAKSGNLNNALAHTTSPLIATFDADMIPQHTFLLKTVPYFLLPQFIKENGSWRLRSENEMNENSLKLGLVQTPQSFYNPDLFQFNLYAEQNIPNEQDFFSREVNTLRNASNAVAYTGSNTVLSRQALQEIGGFPLHTITEDFEVSVRLQQAGYITYATDEVQAAGLTTTTIPSMIKQRTRWARGIIQTLQNTRAVFSPKLSIQARITYLNSFLYWWSFFNRLIFILSPILFALFDFQIVDAEFWELIIFWMPAYAFYSTGMRYLSSNIRNQRWSQIVDTVLMPYLIIPVLLETLFIHERKFKVTSKSKQVGESRWHNLKYAIPHIVLLLLSLAAIVRFVAGKYGWALFYSSILIFWLVYNLVALCYAIFFMIGRRTYRDSERILAKERITIQANNQTYAGITSDVSDTGIAFTMPQAIYLPNQETLQFTVETERYTAHLEGTILYVKKSGEEWRYAASIHPKSDDDRRQYSQIIYDRQHSLPTQMNLWITAYDDMIRNIRNRVQKPSKDKRKQPRIPLDCAVTFENGETCTLRSFNYLYFSAVDLHSQDSELCFLTASGIKVMLHRTGIATKNPGEELLSVENLRQLAENDLLEKLLDELRQGSLSQKEETWAH